MMTTIITLVTFSPECDLKVPDHYDDDGNVVWRKKKFLAKASVVMDSERGLLVVREESGAKPVEFKSWQLPPADDAAGRKAVMTEAWHLAQWLAEKGRFACLSEGGALKVMWQEAESVRAAIWGLKKGKQKKTAKQAKAEP